jgi:DNA-binding winged helix-turn-helix (wHTH) protein/Tfp pilus assembly protein PilF
MHSSQTSGEKPSPNGFVTGEWTVTPTRNLLVRGQEQVRVEPRVMDVLVHLAERAGEVVSKEELVERVWEGRFVTDDVLTVTIYALRKALGDDARRPRYLETVSRRGYRWIAPVKSESTATATIPPEAPPSRAVAWRTLFGTAALVVFAVGAFWMLTTPRRGRHVPTAEAQEAYVKGRYFLDQRSIKGLQQALEQFERAVALDPQSPAFHAGLADAYSAMSDFGVASPAEMRPRAMKAALRALNLDPQSAEGHEALGRAQFLFDWDFARAQRSLARAVALDAEYMPAYQATAWLQSARGQDVEAIAAARRALQLDPVNTARYTELAWVLTLGGHYDEARQEIERALQLNPRSFETWLMKGWTYELNEQPDAAFAAYREGLRVGGVGEEALRRIEGVYRAEGLAGYYRGWLDQKPRSGSTPMSNTFRAMVYVRAGELDRAIESLQQAYQKRESALAWVNVEPRFQRLRSDARFQQIAARVGASLPLARDLAAPPAGGSPKGARPPA